MAVTVQEIYDWLDSIAPFETAEGFDNVGLLAGDPHASVDKLLLCVDVTEEVVREAASCGAQLIVSHHPLMFGGIQRIDYTVPEGRTLCGILQARMNVIAMHTNWDQAQGGVSDSLAKALELNAVASADEYIRVGTLKAPASADELHALVQGSLHAPVRRFGAAASPLSRVAVGGGACGDRAQAALALGAQAFVVGEIKHHELLFACGQGLVVFDAGHYASEAVGMAALYERFQAAAMKNQWQLQALLYSKAPFPGAMQAL